MIYAVLDIETTGGRYNEEAITEIAIHRFDGDQVVDTFVSLINPEREIQPFVVQLTGINNKMLRNAPKFYEVAKRVIEITNDCILVAHNAGFDYRVLRNEFQRLGYPFDVPTLCTVELSQKLMPGLETYSLGKLCRSIGIPVSDRHRANGDALAALKLFEVLLQKDAQKMIVKNTIREGNKRDLSSRLLKIVEALPDRAGLFYFHRYNGDILYIGKGRNIRKTVNQIFLRTSRRARSLIKEMESVRYEITGSELVAQLKFHEEVILHKPPHNKRQSASGQVVRFNNENMILVDKGRDPGEKSVVLIEQNEYRGFAYTDLTYQVHNLEVLKGLVRTPGASEQHNHIIKQYLAGNRVEKIIRF